MWTNAQKEKEEIKRGKKKGMKEGREEAEEGKEEEEEREREKTKREYGRGGGWPKREIEGWRGFSLFVIFLFDFIFCLFLVRLLSPPQTFSCGLSACMGACRQEFCGMAMPATFFPSLLASRLSGSSFGHYSHSPSIYRIENSLWVP